MHLDPEPSLLPPIGGRTDRHARLALSVFVVALAILLAGYMFLGRGFAHIGLGPIYIGEVVLLLGIVALLLILPPMRLHWLHAVLVIFMTWGLFRTAPYLTTYGTSALRDAVLWGYALFAIVVSLIATSGILAWIQKWYRRAAVAFVLWLVPAWLIFGNFGEQLPRYPGSDVSIPFFKNQDMAVHLAGIAAFIVVGAMSTARGRWFLREFAVAVPLGIGVYITGTISRGALAAVAGGLGALMIIRPVSRHWLPILAGSVVVATLVALSPWTIARPPDIIIPETPSASPSPSAGATARPSDSPDATPSPTLAPQPTPIAAGRDVSPGQLFENVISMFGASSDEGLEGTKQFRIAWWSKIIDYTIGGPYFWTGKGYGINLADDDGFQPTADGSLRAPHNSHFSVLARSGVPGFILWIILQVGFGLSLLLAAFRARRRDMALLAAVSAWILVYWFAMMVNTSFDPYLEGPQGGIWFWTLFGLGVASIRLIGHGHERDA